MPVKIAAFEAENVKRIKAVELEPAQDGLTVIGGRNGQGKTSVLDAIAWSLGGNRKKPTDAKRRDGAADPFMRVELSNGLIVERKGKNSTLTVTDAAGMRGGQQLLDAFVHEFALDVPKWMAMSEKDRALSLLETLGIGAKLDELDAREREAAEERTLLGREAKRAKGYAESMPMYEDAPDEPVDVASIMAELGDAQERNTARIERRAALERYADRLQDALDEIDELAKKLAEAHADADEWRMRIEAVQAEADAMGGMEDTEAFMGLLDTADEANRKCAANAAAMAAAEAARKAADAYASASAAVDAIRAERAALLDSAEMPLDGLTVEDGCLAYNGSRWDCMSGSEQLTVAAAVARKLNPECGFVLVDKLEQFDPQTLAEFGEWAEENGLQVIGTRVGSDDSCTVIIEDGRVEPVPGVIEAADAAAGDAAKWVM